MANTFKSYGTTAIGTTLTDAYTVAAATTATVIGMSVANLSVDTVITVDVVINKGVGGTGTGTDYYLVKNAPIAPGGALVVVGGDQKLVMETGNKIKVKSNTAASVDAIVSALEIS